MGSKTVSFQGALEALNCTDPDAAATFNTRGQKPQQLANMAQAREYIVIGQTPNDFINEHGTLEFDFIKRQMEFKKICMDYDNPLVDDERSKAVFFCAKVIYEIGPESRQVKGGSGDKLWKFNFMYADGNGKLDVRDAFVSTFKEDSNSYKPEADGSKIILTVKHASLLAIDTLNRLNKISLNMNNPVPLLTPLAGAIFSKDDIGKVANALGLGTEQAINMINASCQSGGQPTLQ